MLSKNKIKFIRSLAQKKYRDENKCFLAEGAKTVCDLLGHFPCLLIAGTEDFFASHPQANAEERVVCSVQEIATASLLKSPREVIAVFSQQRTKPNTATSPNEQLLLALDGVQDPGNLGTILRLADWFGIRHVYCSSTCADTFSPKVVQATMGALARVEAHYVDLPSFLANQPANIPVYGTFLDGTDIYKETLTPHGIIVMGSEGNGISPEVASYINQRLYIPPYPVDASTSESLNVAIATAITCAEFRRQSRKIPSDNHEESQM